MAAGQRGPEGTDAHAGPGPERRSDNGPADGGQADDHGQSDHENLVRSRSGELARLAYLVTGDREQAIGTTCAALGGLRDEWSDVLERGAPQAEARTAVVRRLLPRRHRGAPAGTPARLVPAETVGGWPGDDEHPAYGRDADDELDPAVLQAYAAEPVTTRVALVLAEVDHVDRPTVAAALGTRTQQVDDAIDGGLDRIGSRRVARAKELGRDRPTEAIGPHLRRVLLTHSASAGLPADLTEDVATLRGRTVRRRQLLTAGVGGLALAAFGAVGVPALLRQQNPATLTGAGSVGGPSATPSLDDANATPVALSWDAIWRWPARGSMIGDSRVLAVTRTTQDRCIFAERSGAAILVVTARHEQSMTDGGGAPDPLAAMLTIQEVTDRGTANTTRIGFGVTGTGPFAVTATSYGTGRLFVLARPEVASVDVSSTVRFSSDGKRTRIGWQPTALRDGVAQVPTPALGSFGMSVRYAGHHASPYSTNYADAGLFRPWGVPQRGRQWDATQILAAVTGRVRAVTSTLTGLAPASISVAVAHQLTLPGSASDAYLPDSVSGQLPSAGDPVDTRLAIVLASLPGGARLRSAALWHPAASPSGPVVFFVEEASPYPAPALDRRPLVLQSVALAQGQRIGVVAPGAAAVRFSGIDLAIGQKATVPVIDGLALLDLRGWTTAAAILTLDAAGRRLSQWPLVWDQTGDPWDLDG